VTDPVRTAPTPTPPTWRERLELIASPPMLAPGQIAVGAVALLALVVGGWFLLRQPTGPPPEDALTRADRAPAATTTTTAAVLVVHAAGAVVHPGVYRVAPGARVFDVVDAAGGPAPDADVNRLNLAAPVADGSQVYVPRVGEAVPATSASAVPGPPSGPLDLNTATLEQLDSLPGVGPATAKAIIAERQRRGGFRSVEDLLDVRGIGPAKLDALRDLVTV
jgi:competence protein ComEA